MDINLLPSGTSCLVDANIFIYHLSGDSNDCSNFLTRVENGEVELHITTIIVAEILHRRMMGEAISKGLVTAGKTLNKIKANPLLITLLTEYITDVEDVLKLPIKIIEVVMSDITTSHALRNAHGLFTNDSINLACAQRFGINDIVSHDTDFARVPTINLWSPSDI